MALKAGERLGPYRILARLGAGGMGEVYRARDERLERDVALKVMPPEAAADPDRQRRFAQEARAASALNHPNILTVHDVGMEAGVAFIVSELVDGEALDRIVAQGAVPLRKALDIAVQAADGLAAAHGAGIVHRDLKPANLMVTRAGLVKILDFGLAKTVARAAAAGDQNDTIPGVVMGTAKYMSPEQALGNPLDFRSDQFSFGLVLYELLTGTPAFARSSTMGSLAAIIEEEPRPMAEINPALPPVLRWSVERCLHKDREQRYACTADLHRTLQEIREHLAEAAPAHAGRTAVPRRRGRMVLAVLLATLAAFAAGLLLPAFVGPELSADFSSYRMTPLVTDAGYEGSPAWSPDGNNIAYEHEVEGVRQIFVRSMSSSLAARITHSQVDCLAPFWDAEGTRIYYTSPGKQGRNLWSIGVSGGASELLRENVDTAAMAPDGHTLAFLRSDPTGTQPLSLWIGSKRYERGPFASRRYRQGFIKYTRDGRHIGAWLARWDGRSEFWMLPLPDGEPRMAFSLAEGCYFFSWMPDNRRIVFGGAIPGSTGMDLRLADTRTGAMPALTATTYDSTLPGVSWDGSRIAFTASESDFDVVEVPVAGGPAKPLLATSRNEFDAACSPDGTQLAYSTDRVGSSQIWLKARGQSWERPLVTEKDIKSWVVSFGELSFSPDGQRLAYSVLGGRGHAIYVSNVAGGPPVLLNADGSDQRSPTWSPDGSWVAYMRNVDGKWSLVKAPSGGGGQPVTIQENRLPGHPRWSPKGDWIACENPGGLDLIAPDGGSRRTVSRSTWVALGWSADGSTILGIQRTATNRLVVAALAAATGQEKTAGEIDIPAGAALEGFSLTPDGKTFATSLFRPRADIWVIEGFFRPKDLRARLFSRW